MRSPGFRRALLVLAVAVLFTGLLLTSSPADSGNDQAPERGGGDMERGYREWPLFGGSPGRNLVNLLESGMPTDWCTTPRKYKNVKWVVEVGSKAHGLPVISGGKIFIGTNNAHPRNPLITGDKSILMCFRESDGRFLWQAVHDKLPSGRVNDWPEIGLVSTPAVEDNRIYYVSNRCELICADTAGFQDGRNDGVKDEKYRGRRDADIVWRLDMFNGLGVFPHNASTSSPLIAGDLVFLVTSNGVDEGHINIPAPKAPSFLAVNKRTGKVVWKDHSPGKNIMHGQWSSPAYAVVRGVPQVIFPGGDGFLYAFDPPTGRLLWKFDCNPKAAKWVLGGTGDRSDFIATPVVWENRLYIGVGQDPEHKKGVGHLWCIDLERAVARGKVNANHDVSPVGDNFDPAAPVNRHSALAWHYGGLAPPLAPRDFIFGRTLSTCAVHDGLVYAAEYDGILHCLDARTGKKYWEHDMQADTWASPLWVDGKIYLGNESGDMLVFAHGKKKSLLKTIETAGRIRTAAVAANGVLYVVPEDPCKLWAFELR